MNGIYAAACALLLALLFLWAAIDGAARRREAARYEHDRRRRVLDNLDRWQQGAYRNELREQLALHAEIDEILSDAA